MAATTDTQRLISVSLGKIAQSRGQRGGINLHKNLLVATVLHKARTAYMMESYSFKQKQEQFVLQSQQHQQHLAALQHANNTANAQQNNTTTSANGVSDKGEMCQAPRDSNMGQAAGTPEMSEETRSEICVSTGSEVAAQEPMALQNEPEIVYDKENAPPAGEDRLAAQTNVQTVEKSGSVQSQNDHLAAATQLSLDAQLASLDNGSSGKQSVTRCNVLKRRRDNPAASATEYECPASKKARVSFESAYSLPYSDFSSDISDSSSDESDYESEPEAMYTSETPQINNLVTIFNSGFSGLCPISDQSELSSSGCQSDLDMSNSSPQLRLRPESPSPAFSRKVSEPSLLCSSQVGRLESLPSAIVLSA